MRMSTLARVSGTGELLEGSTPAAGPPGYLSNKHGLSSAPIQSDWIIEGKPRARNRRLAGSTDGLGSTYMWDCTAGRFNWYYDIDETVYLVEGSITLVDSAGQHSQLWAGDTFFFPKDRRNAFRLPLLDSSNWRKPIENGGSLSSVCAGGEACPSVR